MFKSITVIKNGKTFECECTPELGGAMCGVAIYEVKRPTWRIFRRAYRGYKTFWINDYNTITNGVVGMVEADADCAEEEGTDEHARDKVSGNGGESHKLCNSREKKSRKQSDRES